MTNTIYSATQNYPRLDHFLVTVLPDLSRSQIEKIIKSGQCKKNNVVISKKNTAVISGDQIEIQINPKEITEYRPTFKFDKLFEDEYILIINKPVGISVHKGHANDPQETIQNAFQYYYPQILNMPDNDRPGIVHRLDKETSGILLLAKDNRSLIRLQKQFKKRRVQKTYLALVQGHMRYQNGTLDYPLIRSRRDRTKFAVAKFDDEQSRSAITEYTSVIKFSRTSLVRVHPKTGRTHQIRVHLSHYGTPVLGDKLYGKVLNFPRLALHAYKIEFTHPATNQTIISYAPIPADFLNYCRQQLKDKNL